MTPAQIEHIEETLFIDYHFLNLITEDRGTVLVSYTKNGILDTGFDPTYDIDIKEGGASMVGFPMSLTGTQAYDAKYSLKINDWNPNLDHSIKVTVNSEIIRTLTLPAEGGATPVVTTAPFNPADTNVTLTNTDRGLKLKLNICNPKFRTKVKNVVIEKAEGFNAVTKTFQSSVPVPYTIPSLFSDYPSAFIGGSLDAGLDALKFDPIYNNRQNFVARVEYLDDYNNYIEEPNQDLIDNYDPTLIISVAGLASLDPTVNNDLDAIYYVVADDKYYRYRPDLVNLPFQAFNQETSYTTKMLDLSDLDGDNDGTFDLFVDGTKATGTVVIRSAIKDTIGDLTSFSTTALSSSDLNTYLDAGVDFMEQFSEHTDITVVEGLTYHYVVKIQTWDGFEYTIFDGYKKREVPSRTSVVPTGLNLSDLTIPLVGESALTENDFQSGVSHNGCKVFLSFEDEDLKDYVRNKKIEEDCKCRNL